MRKASSTTNIVDDLTSIFGGASSSGEFRDVEGKLKKDEERDRSPPTHTEESCVCEVQLPVHHCLLALPGSWSEGREFNSSHNHPQALAQCESTLITKLGLNATRESACSTAAAAKHIAVNQLPDTAAIASIRAAELYGLHIFADGIQDNARNVTRFVLLAREPIIPRTDRPFKTSIVFAHGNIRLMKIGSRPQRQLSNSVGLTMST
ncbi:hypothetical protein IFM89_020000 [Coptis chinensis]|uniref:Prephenate dehydratase domain-containing protein n=1 Tax=Coptis chinensis TaxID=261450 RepID=A0A835LWH7_9MAGN|nr:hypothetical protein IFM89_020000 [Coptis chinensis]